MHKQTFPINCISFDVKEMQETSYVFESPLAWFETTLIIIKYAWLDMVKVKVISIMKEHVDLFIAIIDNLDIIYRMKYEYM